MKNLIILAFVLLFAISANCNLIEELTQRLNNLKDRDALIEEFEKKKNEKVYELGKAMKSEPKNLKELNEVYVAFKQISWPDAKECIKMHCPELKSNAFGSNIFEKMGNAEFQEELVSYRKFKSIIQDCSQSYKCEFLKHAFAKDEHEKKLLKQALDSEPENQKDLEKVLEDYEKYSDVWTLNCMQQHQMCYDSFKEKNALQLLQEIVKDEKTSTQEKIKSFREWRRPVKDCRVCKNDIAIQAQSYENIAKHREEVKQALMNDNLDLKAKLMALRSLDEWTTRCLLDCIFGIYQKTYEEQLEDIVYDEKATNEEKKESYLNWRNKLKKETAYRNCGVL